MNDMFDRLTDDQRAIIDKYVSAVPVKLGAMAEELGLKVFLSTLEPGVSGEIRRVDDDSFVIRVNRHENINRQRFTLAHEISHFLLHKDHILDKLTDDVLYRSNLSSFQEIEANKLAAALVMPRAKIEEHMALYDGIDEAVASDMAREFGVSEEAMLIRIGLV